MDHSRVIASVLSNFDTPPQPCGALQIDGSALARRSFREEILKSRKPVHVKGGIPQRHLDTWSLHRLAERLQGRQEPLWVIRGHAEQGGTKLVEISVEDYLSYLLHPEERAGEVEPLYVTISKEFMDLLPRMDREFELDRLLPLLYSCDAFAFLGPERTVTGLHADTYHSLFYQVWGKKTFVLLPPTDGPNVYVSRKYEWSTRLSGVPSTIGGTTRACERPPHSWPRSRRETCSGFRWDGSTTSMPPNQASASASSSPISTGRSPTPSGRTGSRRGSTGWASMAGGTGAPAIQ